MKILVFGHIPTWAGGKQEQGLANVIYNLAYAMSKEDGVEVTLAATDVNETQLEKDKLHIKGWTKRELICYIIMHPIWSIMYSLYLFKNRFLFPPHNSIAGYFFKGVFLRKTIKYNNPDILHLHEASSWFYIKIVPQNVKIVVTFHCDFGISNEISFSQSYSILEQRCLYSERISTVYFISHNLLERYKSYYKNIISPTDVILNAYDDKVFSYIEHIPYDNLRICTIGSIQSIKGQSRVLEGINKSGVFCFYYTIGTGSHEECEALKQYSRANSINYIHLGKKKPQEIRELLSEMDYMILPSSSEGFGLVFLETIACGVKVVLPKQLPIVQEKSIIKPGINSILLDDCSSESISLTIKELEKKILYDHKSVSDSISSSSWQQIAKQYINSFKIIT